MRSRAFTLIEIMLAVMLALLMLTLAIPSVAGVMAEQRMKKSFEAFDDLVQVAVERSTDEHLPYLIVWTKDAVALTTNQRLDDANAGEATVQSLPIGDGEEYGVTFPCAIDKDPPLIWTFWPGGVCEAADISYKGPAGSWSAHYNPLTARGTFTASETK